MDIFVSNKFVSFDFHSINLFIFMGKSKIMKRWNHVGLNRIFYVTEGLVAWCKISFRSCIATFYSYIIVAEIVLIVLMRSELFATYIR